MRVCTLTYLAVLQACLAQSSIPTLFTEPNTGIRFDTWTVAVSSFSAGLTFGMALPEDALSTDATEFIGYLVYPLFSKTQHTY